jgi:hypothetical protein
VPQINADKDALLPSEVVSSIPVRLVGGGSGRVYHLRIPMPQTGDLREYDELAFEFTRDITPDVENRGVQHIDPPSGAIVLAAAVERAAVAMSYEPAEPGNIFHQGQAATFPLELTNRADQTVTGTVRAICAGPGTMAEANPLRREWTVERAFTLAPGEHQLVPMDVTPANLGWYACRLSVQVDGRDVQSRKTSFAMLAPDTRQDLAASPFGVWCFWNSHTSTRDENRHEKLASIMHKAGWRWTYGGSPKDSEPDRDLPEELREKYNITWTLGNLPDGKRAKPFGVSYDPAKFQAEVVPKLQEAADRKSRDNHFIVLHESRTSKAIVVRYSEFLGGEPYTMLEDETAKFDGQYEQVLNYCRAIREADPSARIVLINDYPAYAQPYLSRGFPAELFDVLGSEGAMFARLPEIQPDWLSLLGQLEQWRLMQQAYGYDKPVWFTEALYHPTGPEDMTDHEQAVVYVREAMLALAGGVERLAATGVVADCSDDYRKSGWGRAGFCYRDPEFNPKPSYAMYAWMTQVLDRARADGQIDAGSTALHVLRFARTGGSPVFPLWVVRGRQMVTLEMGKGTSVVYDAYGNVVAAEFQDGKLTLEAHETPCYVTGAEVVRVAQRRPIDAPASDGKPVFFFDDPSELRAVAEPSEMLANVASTPQIQGAYHLAAEEIDGTRTLRVQLQADTDQRTLLPRYAEFQFVKPLVLTGERPWAIQLRVRGNGGWARIMFELTDAAGRTWTSVNGGTMGEPFVNFDGWQNMRFLLPGNYPHPNDMLRWPGSDDWQGSADATTQPAASIVYPLKLNKLIVAMRPEILYVSGRASPQPVIHLERLVVLPPPEEM